MASLYKCLNLDDLRKDILDRIDKFVPGPEIFNRNGSQLLFTVIVPNTLV